MAILVMFEVNGAHSSKYDEVIRRLTEIGQRVPDGVVVIPLLCGTVDVPAFLEDKLYLDFREDYFHGLVRLAGMVHGVPRQHIEEAVCG